jgi:thioredoxin-related protein
MKKIIVIVLFICAGNIYAQESKLNWLTDLDEAKQMSEEMDKPILMYFTGSDWCAPCKKLKTDFFDSEKFIKKSQRFVLLKVDLPRRSDIISQDQKRKNMLLMQKYNRRGSFPTMVGMNSEGKVLGDINGYNRAEKTDKHFVFLDEIIGKH